LQIGFIDYNGAGRRKVSTNLSPVGLERFGHQQLPGGLLLLELGLPLRLGQLRVLRRPVAARRWDTKPLLDEVVGKPKKPLVLFLLLFVVVIIVEKPVPKLIDSFDR
jgi:hypothetical protein